MRLIQRSNECNNHNRTVVYKEKNKMLPHKIARYEDREARKKLS